MNNKQFDQLVQYGTKVVPEFKAKMDAAVTVGGFAGTRDLLEKMSLEFFMRHPELSAAADHLLGLQKGTNGEGKLI